MQDLAPGSADRCNRAFQAVQRATHEATTRDGSRVLVVDSDKGIKAADFGTCRGSPLKASGPPPPLFASFCLSWEVFDIASRKELAPLPESDAVTSARG